MAAVTAADQMMHVSRGLDVVVRRLNSGWMLSSPVLSADGEVAVISPVSNPGEDIVREIEALGQVRLLIAPNHFHYLGLSSWKERFPQAAVVASEAAIPRIRKKLRSPIDIEPRGEMVAGWRLAEPPGLKNGELWAMGGDEGTTWIVGDAFFNVPGPLSGGMGMALRLTRTAPGLRIGGTWGPLHVKSKGEYASWLADRLDREPPDRLVPLHGDAVSDTCADQLRELVVRWT